MNCVFELSLLVIKDKPKRYPYNVMVWQRAIFCTYDDADTYIRDNIEDWHVLDIFCIYVREKPVGSMLYEEECLAVWLYDERGNLIDKRLDCLFISRKGRKGELRTITENYPTQNANPQILAITGVSADCLYCAKRMRPGA